MMVRCDGGEWWWGVVRCLWAYISVPDVQIVFLSVELTNIK